MGWIEEIHGSSVPIRQEVDLQFPHEPGRSHPEVVTHHHNRLDMLTIALPKSGDQFGALVTTLRMKPLLELVQDQQHFTLGR